VWSPHYNAYIYSTLVNPERRTVMSKDQFMDFMNQVEAAIADYASKQPYDVFCSNCHSNLSYQAEVDSDGDILVTVDPCEECRR
jgi:hypothetical protein